MGPAALIPVATAAVNTGLKASAMQKEQDARDKARRITEAMARAYSKLGSDPAMGSGLFVGDTAYSNIAADPQAVEAQRRALDYLGQVQSGKGLTAEDRAQLFRIKQQQLQTEQSQRGAIMQQAASRGLLNSGSTLAAQLNASQNQANRAQGMGLDVAAQGQARALDAAMKGGYLGTQMRGQSFDEQSKQAAAKDMLERFNRSMMQQQFTNKFNIIGGQAGQLSSVGNQTIYGAERDTQHLGDIASGWGEAGKAVFGSPQTASYDPNSFNPDGTKKK